MPSSRSLSATMSSRIAVICGSPDPPSPLGCDWHSTHISYGRRFGLVNLERFVSTPQLEHRAVVPQVTRMFVDGDWRAADSGAETRASSPATGEDLGAVADGGRDDARRGVAAAPRAVAGRGGGAAVERA